MGVIRNKPTEGQLQEAAWLKNEYYEEEVISMYTPDRWVVLKITNNNTGTVIHKVFGVWLGGYTEGDSWRMNSGITSIKQENDRLVFSGASGSMYSCSTYSYGTSAYGCQILDSFIKNSTVATVEVMPEETDWITLFKTK